MTTSNMPPPNPNVRASDFVLGAFILLGAFLLLAGWMWLKSEPLWKPPQRFSVLFHDVAGLVENAAVYSDGVRVGSIEKIQLKGKRKVLVSLKINEEALRVPVGSSFDIRSNGVVGAKYLDVTIPDAASDSANVAYMTPDTVAWGNDPTRPEIVLNELTAKLNRIDFDQLQYDVNHGMDHIARAADHVTVLSNKLNPVADRAVVLEGKLTALADDLHGTTHRVNKLLNDPKLAQGAKDTLAKLNDMTAHVEASVTKVEKMVSNPELREDIVKVVNDAKQTVAHVHEMVEDPRFGSELHSTMTQARSALARLDLVGRQLNQILSKRAPLIHMLIGRPGKLEEEHEQAAGTLESVPE